MAASDDNKQPVTSDETDARADDPADATPGESADTHATADDGVDSRIAAPPVAAGSAAPAGKGKTRRRRKGHQADQDSDAAQVTTETTSDPVDAAGSSDSDTGSTESTESTESASPSGRRRRRGDRPQPLPGMNPTWWAPVMVTLMVIGLVWIVVFYLVSNGPDETWPVPGIGYGNLAIGFALIMAGFLMTTRWK